MQNIKSKRLYEKALKEINCNLQKYKIKALNPLKSTSSTRICPKIPPSQKPASRKHPTHCSSVSITKSKHAIAGCNNFHNTLRIFDVLPSFFTKSEMRHDYYL